MKTVLVTGSQGFIGSYICSDLLKNGYRVIGIDNFSKYGKVKRNHDSHPNFQLHELDLTNEIKLFDIDPRSIDYIIAGAAMIGGISYFHKYAADLLRVNNQILNTTFEFARHCENLNRVVVISSSMVFERTNIYPTPETEIYNCPPPFSTYGMQKLMCEYYAKGYWEQYNIPYTIVRPFNCVGVGENDAVGSGEEKVGNVKMMLSHVLPDLINRLIQLGANVNLPILGNGNQVRHYTNGADIAIGIRMAMESEKGLNNDFNISHDRATTVLELANMVSRHLYGEVPIGFSFEKPFENDVQYRSPCVDKAKEVLGFTATISVEQSVAEVCDWMRRNDV